MTLARTQKAMSALDVELKTAGRGAPPFSMAMLTQVSVIIGTVFMVFVAIVACVYPAMMWWYLSRPASRAACMMKKPEPESLEPDPTWEPTA